MQAQLTVTLSALALLAASAAHAQLGGMNLPGVPGASSVSGASMESATGVPSYCVRNKVVGGADASSVLGTLSGKPAVKESDDYKAGLTGVLTGGGGGGKPLSLDRLPSPARKQLCDQVLKQATTFL